MKGEQCRLTDGLQESNVFRRIVCVGRPPSQSDHSGDALFVAQNIGQLQLQLVQQSLHTRHRFTTGGRNAQHDILVRVERGKFGRRQRRRQIHIIASADQTKRTGTFPHVHSGARCVDDFLAFEQSRLGHRGWVGKIAGRFV